MGKVFYDVSMSLDGFIAGANPRPEAGLGDGGEQLHEWGFNSTDPRNREIVESWARTGAIIVGRTTYDLSVPYWEADGPMGAARVPTLVVSHSVPQDIPDGSVYSFVNGVEAAFENAKNWQEIRIFQSREQTLRSSSSHLVSLTKSRFTSSRCCSAGHAIVRRPGQQAHLA